MSRPTGWKSYDSVAEEYERLTPSVFGRLANDLVELLAPDPSALVLDAGTGTGTAADAVARRLAPDGAVVGLDPSPAMLSLARGRATGLVTGALPGLPFPHESFDAALANLVLSHLDDVEGAVADLVRVIRPEGRLGATAWPEDRDPPPDNDAPRARRLIESALDETGLPLELPEQGAPAEEWLKDEGNLRSVLSGAGLEGLAFEVQTYRYKLTAADYLGWHAWAGRGRYLRSVSDQAAVGRFERHAVATLEQSFPDGIRMVSPARVVVGTKPG
ncbi:MAG: methyltransferase domain-containing protein [Actinobacteria bacterium]|nr:methyltransferase domain-containing protein [Actinomycetota bacterium]